MPNLVITSDVNRVYIAFNDYSTQAGMPSGNWQKSTVTTSLNTGNIDVFFIITLEQNWRFSYNGSVGSMQVDSVDGVAPISNVDLKTKLDAILAIQTIPDQTGNAGKFLQTDGSNLSWAAAGGGTGDLLAANNLSDLANIATAKVNLSLVKADVGLSNVVNADTTTTANITDSANKRFLTDAQQTVVGNTSGTNTGDNATNTQYSGLAASKLDTTAFSGLAKITVGTTTPVAPSIGDLWVDTN